MENFCSMLSCGDWRGGGAGREGSFHNVLSRRGGWRGRVTNFCSILSRAIERAEGSFYNVLSWRGIWRGRTGRKISVTYCPEAIGWVEGSFNTVLSRREG